MRNLSEKKTEWTPNASPSILLKGKEWHDPQATGEGSMKLRDRVVPSHPRNAKEFYHKLEEPQDLPHCPKENATLLHHGSNFLDSCWERMNFSNVRILMWYLSGAVPGSNT